MKAKQYKVLAVHPSAYGFGWALFDGPKALVNWGTADIRENKNARALLRIDKIIADGKPRILALEVFDGEPSRRRERIRRLYQAIVKRAAERGLIVRIFSRGQIERVFVSEGARTREQIAAAIATRFEMLRIKLPPKRKVWDSEDPKMALFAAVACALAYYASVSPTDQDA